MIDFIIEYWLGIAFAGTIAVAAGLVNHYKNKFVCRFDEHDMFKAGVRTLLRAEIIKSYNYYKEKGYCPIYAKDNILAMGKAYHDLGGNGTTVHLLEELSEMPTEKKYVESSVDK